jgi:hypothetical protein
VWKHPRYYCGPDRSPPVNNGGFPVATKKTAKKKPAAKKAPAKKATKKATKKSTKK